MRVQALADETRLRMLRLLLRSSSALINEISERLKVSVYNASKHLRVMREAGLLETRRSCLCPRTLPAPRSPEPRGGVLAAVVVTAKDVKTEVTRSTTTNQVGVYLFLVLRAGATYKVSATRAGFTTAKTRGHHAARSRFLLIETHGSSKLSNRGASLTRAVN